jgi:hypothetical protein
LKIYAIIDLFSPAAFVIMNQCWTTYILKNVILGGKILTLLKFARTEFTVVLLWIQLVSVYPLSKLETSPPLTSVMSQELAVQQGASRLQTSANLWTFSINMTFHLRTHFRLLNPTELRQYRVTWIIYCLVLNFSLVLVREACGTVVGWGTLLQAGRWRVRFPMRYWIVPIDNLTAICEPIA